MFVVNCFIFLLTGAIAGWLAGQFTQGEGYGCIGNILMGIIGGMVGGFVFSLLGISGGTGFIAQIFTAAIGAVVLIGFFRVITPW